MTRGLFDKEFVSRMLLAIVLIAIAYALIEHIESIVYILLGYLCAVLISEVGPKRRASIRAPIE